MGDEEKLERRSMVGAPPTSVRASMIGAPPSAKKLAPKTPLSRTPARSSTARSGAKRKREESGDEDHGSDSEKNSEGEKDEDSEDGVDTPSQPKKKKRRQTKHLTDYTTRVKRREKQRAAEEKYRQDHGEPTSIVMKMEKPPSPTPTPEPIMPNASVNSYHPLQLFCDHLLRKVMSKDPEEYFAFPVTPQMAPDYHKIITEPMDFSKIRQKIEDNLYNTVAEMRADAELIVTNALAYNNPNTVYHCAATRMSTIIRYYFSEQYLRYAFHTLPLANTLPLDKVGLGPLESFYQRFENKGRATLADHMTSDDCLQAANPVVRSRLAPRLPEPSAKIAFLDNVNGATVLNVIGDDSKKNITIGDIVGPLEEGTPGMLNLGEHRLSGQQTVGYLSYGSFCSFAPQYDSTWATLSKRDSDLLLRTYGDRGITSDVMSLCNAVADADEHYIKVVNDLLDTMTDGEHSRAMDIIEKKSEKIELSSEMAPIGELLAEVETLKNLGIDVDFVEDVRQQLNPAKPQLDLQMQINLNGMAIMDLNHLQQQRLSSQPQLTLTKVLPPGHPEMMLVDNIQQTLVTQISALTTPAQVASEPIVRNAIGIDDDILGEFFVT